MRRLAYLSTLALALVASTFAGAETPGRANGESFASDFQTVPVMGNTVGKGGTAFQTFVALLNPTADAFTVEATLYDDAGTAHEASIALGSGELKTYQNFLAEVFDYSGGGAVTFRSPESIGGTHGNRFIVTTEVWTSGDRYGTSIPALEFAGSSSDAFAAGIVVDSTRRTNIGCFNQSGLANRVKASFRDNTGTQLLGSTELNLAPNGWAQTAVSTVVTGGYVEFEPSEDAVCYAVVVDNSTNDGRFIPAVEYEP